MSLMLKMAEPASASGSGKLSDPALPEYRDGLPNICGAEQAVEQAIRYGAGRSVFRDSSPNTFDDGRMNSGFAMALHMQQPLVPAGGHDIGTAAMISNLRFMMEHQDIGDNHNAPIFAECYKRVGEFVPQLIDEGRQPRIALDYSGVLLHGLREMGRHDIIDSLKRITMDPRYRHAVEWLGTAWGHAVAPSTPPADFRDHVRAWQHHFAGIFGWEALSRVRGFSPPEMALPNHPDVAHAFVQTLREAGYQWVLVQEHSVEQPNGRHVRQPHLPHRLLVLNGAGEQAEIIAIIKTQGSDTKLVAQGQPYYEAKGLSRTPLNSREVPPLVTQIADGENGGVMMNEFPSKYFEVMREASGSPTPPMNPTEYLEQLDAAGVTIADLPTLQPKHQARIWERMEPGAGTEALAHTIDQLGREDHNFHVEGGSWTNDRSWVHGYDHVLGPMERLSARFAAIARDKVPAGEARYLNALFHLLAAEQSCFRYWGEGTFTNYAKEIIRRGNDILTYDFPNDTL